MSVERLRTMIGITQRVISPLTIRRALNATEDPHRTPQGPP